MARLSVPEMQKQTSSSWAHEPRCSSVQLFLYFYISYRNIFLYFLYFYISYISRDSVGSDIMQQLFFSIRLTFFFHLKWGSSVMSVWHFQKQEHWGKWQRLQMKPPPCSVTPALWVPRSFINPGAASSPSWLCAFLPRCVRAASWGARCRQAQGTCDKAGARHQPAWQALINPNTAAMASVQRDWAVRSLEIMFYS